MANGKWVKRAYLIHHGLLVLVPGLLALVAVRASDLHLESRGITQVRTASKEVVGFPRSTLIFKPTRGDLTVGGAVLSVYCSNPEDVRVNGVTLDPAWSEVRLTQAGRIIVDRTSSAVPDASVAWTDIYLEHVATNQFSLPP